MKTSLTNAARVVAAGVSTMGCVGEIGDHDPSIAKSAAVSSRTLGDGCTPWNGYFFKQREQFILKLPPVQSTVSKWFAFEYTLDGEPKTVTNWFTLSAGDQNPILLFQADPGKDLSGVTVTTDEHTLVIPEPARCSDDSDSSRDEYLCSYDIRVEGLRCDSQTAICPASPSNMFPGEYAFENPVGFDCWIPGQPDPVQYADLVANCDECPTKQNDPKDVAARKLLLETRDPLVKICVAAATRYAGFVIESKPPCSSAGTCTVTARIANLTTCEQMNSLYVVNAA